MSKKIKVFSPVTSGEAYELEKVSDPVFANKQMGDGLAFTNESDTIIAPCNGTISFIASTKHAISLDLENGAEIFIHVGLGSVELEGEGFSLPVKRGQNVQKGQILVELQRDFLIEKIGSLETFLLVTREGFLIEDVRFGRVNLDQSVFTIAGPQ